MNEQIKERFVDYLFMLERGEIPPPIKPMIVEQNGDHIIWDNGTMRGSLTFGLPPYEANMPLLGFALFGMFWTHILEGVDKLIKKRMKEEGRKK